MVVCGVMLSAYELNLRLGTVLSLAGRFFGSKLKKKCESTKPCDIPRSPMRMAEISAVISIKALDKSWHLNFYFRLCFSALQFLLLFTFLLLLEVSLCSCLEARTEGTHSMLVLHVDTREWQTCSIKLHRQHKCALDHPL